MALYIAQNMGNTSLKNVVEEILTRTPQSRDCDYLLYIEVLLAHNVNSMSMTGFTLLEKMKKHEIPSLETVCRWRRRLQQMNPYLRGNFWKQRNEKQPVVREELEYKN
jgi:hypothetical protein